MNTKIFLLIVAILTGLFFVSCEKDDETVAKPVVTITELGYENSKVGYIGSDLHIEAEIVAEGKIDKVTLEIHQESSSSSWEFDTVYTEFSGLKNTTFHKHIDIPVDVDSGEYHVHFIVIDQEGQQTLVEEELDIQEPDDAVAPVISITSAPATNQSYSNGQTITIEGNVSDDIALGGMYIGLVRENQSLADADVDASNTITMLHTHDFSSPTSYNFSASITVGAAQDNNITPKDITGDIAWQSANYYIVVKCKDAFGGNWSYSSQYPIVINY